MSGNIILIDDHTLFRRGIRSVLDEADYEVIGEAADGLSGVKLVEQLRPDLVLLDLDMPVMNGREALGQILSSNPEQKVVMLTVSEDGCRIRAAQGHSTGQVRMNLAPQTPPDVLYHGTATRFLDSIMRQGLQAGARHHVHLSADRETAVKVGQRHGKPVVLRVDAAAMHQAGRAFYLSDNQVWLTEAVPPQYLVVE